MLTKSLLFEEISSNTQKCIYKRGIEIKNGLKDKLVNEFKY